MTTTTDRRPPPTSNARKTESSDGNPRRTVLVVAAVLIALVGVAVFIALILGGGDTTERADVRETTRIPAGELSQTADIQVDGATLARFDADLATDPAIGQVAPEVTASYFDGTEVTLSPGDGQARVLLFFAHWCPHCQAEVESLVDWFDAAVLPGDIEVVAVSTGVDDGAPNHPPSDWFVKEEWPYPVLRDSAGGDMADAFGLSSFPYAVGLNSDGQVVGRVSGNMTPAQWDSLLFSTLR